MDSPRPQEEITSIENAESLGTCLNEDFETSGDESLDSQSDQSSCSERPLSSVLTHKEGSISRQTLEPLEFEINCNEGQDHESEVAQNQSTPITDKLADWIEQFFPKKKYNWKVPSDDDIITREESDKRIMGCLVITCIFCSLSIIGLMIAIAIFTFLEANPQVIMPKIEVNEFGKS